MHNYYNNKYRTVEACEEARSITSGGRRETSKASVTTTTRPATKKRFGRRLLSFRVPRGLLVLSAAKVKAHTHTQTQRPPRGRHSVEGGRVPRGGGGAAKHKIRERSLSQQLQQSRSLRLHTYYIHSGGQNKNSENAAAIQKLLLSVSH